MPEIQHTAVLRQPTVTEHEVKGAEGHHIACHLKLATLNGDPDTATLAGLYLSAVGHEDDGWGSRLTVHAVSRHKICIDEGLGGSGIDKGVVSAVLWDADLCAGTSDSGCKSHG